MAANRLLIIDDEPVIAKVIQTIASACGYEVKVTAGPVPFLDQIANWQPTHIVLDLQMPDVDGIELLRSLGAQQNAAKIIIVSGAEGRIVEAAGRIAAERGLNVAGKLRKPFRTAELRHVLDDLAIKDDWCTEQALREAINGKALFLVYQPKIDAPGGQVIGYEALVRWQHAQHGVVYPDKFIPLAESTGLIDQLTEAVLEIGIGQIAAWGDKCTASLSINLSGGNLHDLTFGDRLSARCATLHVDPHRLVLELTETSAMADPLEAMEILTRLCLKGFRLSIDDFGRGYSSLLQLARLPFSELKIDQLFVIESHQSPEARAIVKSTIDLAHNLGLRAVAEGVETPEALQLITDLGCDMAQGNYIGKPMPAAQIPDWLAEWETRRRSGTVSKASSDATALPAPHSPETGIQQK